MMLQLKLVQLWDFFQAIKGHQGATSFLPQTHKLCFISRYLWTNLFAGPFRCMNLVLLELFSLFSTEVRIWCSLKWQYMNFKSGWNELDKLNCNEMKPNWTELDCLLLECNELKNKMKTNWMLVICGYDATMKWTTSLKWPLNDL